MTEQLEFDGFIKHKYELKIKQDSYPDSPREWDNLGSFYTTKNNRYIEREISIYDYERDEEFDFGSDADNDIERLSKLGYIAIPVSIYDHSSWTVFTGVASGWDSGCIGFYVVSREKIREYFGCKRISKKLLVKVISIMVEEVKTFDRFVQGEVWGFEISKDGELLDSCCGFYEEDDFETFQNYVRSYFPDEANITEEQFKQAWEDRQWN